MKAREAYNEIFDVLNKHKNICVFNIDELKRESEVHLFGIELKEEYGLNIDPTMIRSLYWNKVGNYITIGKWGKQYNRVISWSIDGRQPDNEILLQISFPIGPYTFGNSTDNEDYPKEFFSKFFPELKSYNPDYIDDANSALYWKINNAKDIFNSFDIIFQKYQDLNKKDIKRREIERMKARIAKLEEES